MGGGFGAMATRVKPVSFADRTSESSTEEDLAQLQPGEVSVHTALPAWWGEMLQSQAKSLREPPALAFLMLYTLSIPDPISLCPP